MKIYFLKGESRTANGEFGVHYHMLDDPDNYTTIYYGTFGGWVSYENGIPVEFVVVKQGNLYKTFKIFCHELTHLFIHFLPIPNWWKGKLNYILDSKDIAYFVKDHRWCVIEVYPEND